MREEILTGRQPISNDPPLADLLATPVLAALLLALARFDLRERRLPDLLTLPLALLGLGLAALRVHGVPTAEIIGLGAGYAAFWALGEGHHRLRGEEGLGLGDAKLLGAAGAWLGWPALAPLVLVAALGALAWVALGAVRRRAGQGSTRRDLAFGPWLALGLMLLWLLRLARGGE